jgi:hypothetical protein
LLNDGELLSVCTAENGMEVVAYECGEVIARTRHDSAYCGAPRWRFNTECAGSESLAVWRLNSREVLPEHRRFRYNQCFYFLITNMTNIQGSLVAIVTPMHADGSLDLPGLRKLIDWHIEQGTDGIVIVGTTGESPTVSVEEHCELIRVAVEHVNKRVPVIAGSGGNSTAEAIALTRFAREAGADASLQLCLITTVLLRKVCISISKPSLKRWIFLSFCITCLAVLLQICRMTPSFVWRKFRVSLVEGCNRQYRTWYRSDSSCT